MIQFSYPNSQFTNILGGAGVGWSMYVYNTGTTDLASIYSDVAQTIEADNPVISDSNGMFASFYWTGTVDVVIKDENGDTFDSAEGIQDLVSTILANLPETSANIPAGIASGDGDTITVTLPITADFVDLDMFLFRANTGNSGSTNTPNLLINAYPSRRIKKIGGAALLEGDIVANQNCLMVYNESQDYYYLLNPEATNYGVTTVTMTNADVTLTDLQAAKDIIVISGALVANVNLIFPTFKKNWTVTNNTSGAYNVTCKTASGTGELVVQSSSQIFYCDGTNLVAAVKTPATNADALTGTNTLNPIVPSSLKYVLDNRPATTTGTGLVEQATQGEMESGASDKFPDAFTIFNGFAETSSSFKLPKWMGEWFVQFGYYQFGDLPDTGQYNFTISIPDAYDFAPFALVCAYSPTGGGNAFAVNLRGTTTTTIDIVAQEWASAGQGTYAGAMWIAIGKPPA